MRRKILACILVSLFLVPSVPVALPNHRYDTRDNEDGLTIEKMTEELIEFWESWYHQRPWSRKEILESIPKMAEYMATAIHKFQREPVEHNWRGDTSLIPLGKDAHFILGSMAIYETDLRPAAVGGLGEAGLLQCHPKWCMVMDKRLAKMSIAKRTRVVKNDTQLGIELGTKFLAKNIGFCGVEVKRFWDWVFPVSTYGAGSRAFKNGRCISKSFARSRVKKAIRYRKKVRDKRQLLSKILFGISGFLV